MNIYLTFDYELYFGERTGTVERCITEPTTMLLAVADRHNVKMVHFVDAGFLIKLDEFRKKYPTLDKDYSLIINQLEGLWENGHDIQLHIHPHWEDSFYDGNKWIIDPKRYKLADFNENEISDIVKRYKNKLEEITGSGKINAFRAGGWCVQPFTKFKKALYENGIRIDSSVFANGYFESDLYYYDFRNTPLKCKWNFDDNPLLEKHGGEFTEIPISSTFNSPVFYWRLFLLGRLNPYMHKPLGDGIPIPAPGQRFNMLSRWTHNTVSVDGYNATLLNRSLSRLKKRNCNEMVIIGHPKALSRYGLQCIDKFIARYHVSDNFKVFRSA